MKISDVTHGKLRGVAAVREISAAYRECFPSGSDESVVRYVSDRTGLSLPQVRRAVLGHVGTVQDQKGRPRLPDERLRKHVVSTSLTDEEFTCVKHAAEARGMRVRDYMRTILSGEGCDVVWRK